MSKLQLTISNLVELTIDSRPRAGLWRITWTSSGEIPLRFILRIKIESSLSKQYKLSYTGRFWPHLDYLQVGLYTELNAPIKTINNFLIWLRTKTKNIQHWYFQTKLVYRTRWWGLVCEDRILQIGKISFYKNTKLKRVIAKVSVGWIISDDVNFHHEWPQFVPRPRWVQFEEWKMLRSCRLNTIDGASTDLQLQTQLIQWQTVLDVVSTVVQYAHVSVGGRCLRLSPQKIGRLVEQRRLLQERWIF